LEQELMPMAIIAVAPAIAKRGNLLVILFILFDFFYVLNE
jgi:hypothetical protein